MPEFPISSARILLVSQIQGGQLPSLPPCPVRLCLLRRLAWQTALNAVVICNLHKGRAHTHASCLGDNDLVFTSLVGVSLSWRHIGTAARYVTGGCTRRAWTEPGSKFAGAKIGNSKKSRGCNRRISLHRPRPVAGYACSYTFAIHLQGSRRILWWLMMIQYNAVGLQYLEFELGDPGSNPGSRHYSIG